MTAVKIATLLGILGMVASFSLPPLAQTAEVAWLEGIAKLGAIGVLGAIHWWAVAKTIPKLSDDHNFRHSKMVETVGNTMAEQSAAIRELSETVKAQTKKHQEHWEEYLKGGK